MNNEQDREARIAALATFLDPEAFSFESNGPLSHRRETALEKARNRVELEARESPTTAPAEQKHTP